MAKPWSSRFIIRSFHQIASKPSATGNPTSSGISNFITGTPKVIENPSFSSWLFNSQRNQFSSSATPMGVLGKLHAHPELLPRRNFVGFRYFSLNRGMGSKDFASKVTKKPALAVRNAFGRYKEAARLQIEAFWKRNYMVVLGAGGLVVCILLWRLLFGIATTFIGFSEGMAKYGFLALSSAIVAFTGLYFRSRFTVNPDKVYRMAMRKLNTSAGILEVMGAPLTGTDLRAYVMSGGGITLKNFKPRLGSKRCFLIFPIQGSERKGLVSVEVKKKKGQYDMKLLAVDVPMAAGPDQRLFLIGDEEEYRIGGGLISELRDPVVKALAAAKEFEARDEKEDEEDDARELEEAERKHREEVEKLQKDQSQ
ncbi:import inner membrane translocase subunit [Perilla frutescens var. hirtella]|nr:import inner membrane translocase subunit [Perilla frutescens var. frutescens]KAH6792741.1 import inner membrane translocase subunit [Perilla frutescens var. hirtella]